ncbi:unnamed protein product, partial [Brassica rapa subsp. narinosa]
AVLSVFGRGVCPWLALARSFVAGFLFLFSLGLSVVLPVTARESQSGAIVGKLGLWSDVVALGLLSPFLIKMWGLAVPSSFLHPLGFLVMV